MDLRAYCIKATEAASALSIHSEDDEEVVKLTSNAVLLKLEVEAGTSAGVTASCKGSGLSPLGLDDAKAAGSRGRDLTCPECGKTFLSDKAMYGHLRSHPERGYKGAIRPDATASVTAVAGDKKPERKVPQKEAGESPATNMSVTTPAVAGEKRQKEESWLWTKGSVTAKRRRGSSTPSAASAPVAAAQSSSSCSEEEEAAMILLEIASGVTTSETQQSRQTVSTRDAKHQIPEVDEQPMLLDHVARNQMIPEFAQLMSPDHVACDVMAHQTLEDGQQIVQPELAPVVILESQTPEIKELTVPKDAVVAMFQDKKTPANQQQRAAPGRGAKKSKKRRVLNAKKTPETAPPEAANVKQPVNRVPSRASNKKYVCPTCLKSFPTHQALGGHKAAHNKGGGGKHGVYHDDPAMVQAMRNILARQKQSSNAVIGGTAVAEGAVIGAGQDQERHDSGPPVPPAAQHVCAECNMAFRSGQALGGHKRKHWYLVKQQAKAAPNAALRDFDLNELPRDVEGENKP